MSGLLTLEILKISVGQRATDKWFGYVNYLGDAGVGMMLIIKLHHFLCEQSSFKDMCCVKLAILTI